MKFPQTRIWFLLLRSLHFLIHLMWWFQISRKLSWYFYPWFLFRVVSHWFGGFSLIERFNSFCYLSRASHVCNSKNITMYQQFVVATDVGCCPDSVSFIIEKTGSFLIWSVLGLTFHIGFRGHLSHVDPDTFAPEFCRLLTQVNYTTKTLFQWRCRSLLTRLCNVLKKTIPKSCLTCYSLLPSERQAVSFRRWAVFFSALIFCSWAMRREIQPPVLKMPTQKH